MSERKKERDPKHGSGDGGVEEQAVTACETERVVTCETSPFAW